MCSPLSQFNSFFLQFTVYFVCNPADWLPYQENHYHQFISILCLFLCLSVSLSCDKLAMSELDLESLFSASGYSFKSLTPYINVVGSRSDSRSWQQKSQTLVVQPLVKTHSCHSSTVACFKNGVKPLISWAPQCLRCPSVCSSVCPSVCVSHANTCETGRDTSMAAVKLEREVGVFDSASAVRFATATTVSPFWGASSGRTFAQLTRRHRQQRSAVKDFTSRNL